MMTTSDADRVVQKWKSIKGIDDQDEAQKIKEEVIKILRAGEESIGTLWVLHTLTRMKQEAGHERFENQADDFKEFLDDSTLKAMTRWVDTREHAEQNGDNRSVAKEITGIIADADSMDARYGIEYIIGRYNAIINKKQYRQGKQKRAFKQLVRILAPVAANTANGRAVSAAATAGLREATDLIAANPELTQKAISEVRSELRDTIDQLSTKLPKLAKQLPRNQENKKEQKR